MLKTITIIIISSFILTSCADSFKSYFKKSANNRWIDSKGFQGGKRKPLYNKKYINMAKRNVLEENFDDDEEEIELEDVYEISNPTRMNREMYVDMLKADAKRAQRKKLIEYKARGGKGINNLNDDEYPNLSAANERVNSASYNNDSGLQKELAEIKSMLSEAKKDLTKYKCPLEDKKEVLKQLPVKKPVKISPSKDKSVLNNRNLPLEKEHNQINSVPVKLSDTDHNPI